MTDPEHLYEIETDSFSGSPVVRLLGEFDLRSAPDLREALVGAIRPEPEGREGEKGGAGVRPVVLVDMEGLTFLDSTIISVLLSAEQHAQQSGGELRLASVPAHVSRILGMTGIDAVLPSYPTLAEAAHPR